MNIIDNSQTPLTQNNHDLVQISENHNFYFRTEKYTKFYKVFSVSFFLKPLGNVTAIESCFIGCGG